MHQGDFVVFRTEPEKGEQSLRYNVRSERPDWISTARTLEEKTRIYSRPSSTIVPGLVLLAQLTESFYEYEQ